MSESTALIPTENPTPASPLQQRWEALRNGAEQYIDRFHNWMAPGYNDETTPTGIARGPILFGIWLTVVVFGFIGLWATLAPLASAAVAPGKVILSGNKKTIQHLEGGVVEEILVREGDAVKAGQPLIRLNETAARARQDLYEKQYITAKAAEARLIAERDGKENIIWPPVVAKALETSTEMREIVDSQMSLFTSRRASIQGQLDVLDQKVAQSRDEIEGLNAQIASASEQIRLLQDEISGVAKLVAQGNAQKPRLLALQRAQAELRGNRGDYQARISRAEQAIGEAEIQKINVTNEFQNKIAAEMKDTVSQIADLEERKKASEDILQRIIITAPMSGIVTGLQAHTIGGVIKPGDRIMDIVPTDQLLIEAMVSPQDIDVVHPGLEARVRLTAYKSRQVPPLHGKVTQVSADRFENPQTGQAFYLARIALDEDELKAQHDVTLTPGMPADALIVTGSRTLVGYLMAPISDSFRKAFREE
jgi:HlyD family type I secretion membrane fusion protein